MTEKEEREWIESMAEAGREIKRLDAEVARLRAAIGDACRYYPDSGGCAAHPDDTDPCPFCELKEGEND